MSAGARVGTAVLAAALALGVVGASSAFACTTALPARPITDYRAATPVVLGVIEAIGPADITVRVGVVYRGAVGSRLRLALAAWPNVTGWCPFPWGPPTVGDRVLVAVVDRSYWEWPNSAVWIVDGQGRILSPPEAPWSGAPIPTTVGEALRTMGLDPVPDTAVGPLVAPERGAWPATASDLVPWLAGLAWMVMWARRRTPRSSIVAAAGRSPQESRVQSSIIGDRPRRPMSSLTGTGPEWIVSAMVDECPMTKDCPGYDSDRRMCLLRPGDCEFSPPDGDAALMLETPEALTPVASAQAPLR